MPLPSEDKTRYLTAMIVLNEILGDEFPFMDWIESIHDVDYENFNPSRRAEFVARFELIDEVVTTYRSIISDREDSLASGS